MASALEEREELSSKCFICNVKIPICSSYNIYCTSMPQREMLLIDVMSKILKKVLNPSQMRSSLLCRRQVLFSFLLLNLPVTIKYLWFKWLYLPNFICKLIYRCFTLFDELDQISTRFKKLQTDIIKRFTSTCNEYKDDNLLNILNSMSPSKVEELSHIEQENNKSFNDDDENNEKSYVALNEVNIKTNF